MFKLVIYKVQWRLHTWSSILVGNPSNPVRSTCGQPTMLSVNSDLLWDTANTPTIVMLVHPGTHSCCKSQQLRWPHITNALSWIRVCAALNMTRWLQLLLMSTKASSGTASQYDKLRCRNVLHSPTCQQANLELTMRSHYHSDLSIS